MLKLDKIDLKLLHALSENSRRSISQIAKLINTSKNTLLYRIKKLEKNKTILFYQTIINHSLTGVFCGRIMIKFTKYDEKNFSEFIVFIKTLNKIGGISRTYGKYDLILIVYFKKLSDFANIHELIHQKITNNVELMNVCLINELYYCAANKLMFGQHIPPAIIKFNRTPAIIDTKDEFLLKKLRENPKETIVSLAQKCNCTTKTLMQRKHNLEKKKIILRYSIMINHTKLDYVLHHVFWKFSTFNVKDVKRLKEHISLMSETFFITEVFCSNMLETGFLVKNELELHNLLNNIIKKFPELIKSYELLLIKDITLLREN